MAFYKGKQLQINGFDLIAYKLVVLSQFGREICMNLRKVWTTWELRFFKGLLEISKATAANNSLEA